MTLGQRIQELRKQAGLSQEGLGEALGVSRQAVSKWEGDNGIPELDTLIAMSRLFGVTLGQLLGVESPKAAEAPASAVGFTEEQVEDILRRYVEETRQHDTARTRQKRGWLAVSLCVAAALVIFTGVKIGTMSSTIRNLSSQFNYLDNRLSDEISHVTEQLRDILEEESNLLSSFEWELLGFDLEKELVTIQLSASLKTYSPGTEAQFVLEWTRTDGESGQTVGGWVEGPYFVSAVELPMNYHLEGLVRLKDKNGVIREQRFEPINSGMNPAGFELEAGDLQTAFVLTYGSGGITSTTVVPEGEDGARISIRSFHPEQLYPTQATLVGTLNGEEILRQDLEIERAVNDTQVFYGKGGERAEVTLKTGDELAAQLYLTDNLGREQVIVNRWTVKNGQLERREG